MEIKLYSRDKERSIVITAAVVDEIMRLPPKDEDRFKELTKSSVEALKKRRGSRQSQKTISSRSQEEKSRC